MPKAKPKLVCCNKFDENRLGLAVGGVFAAAHLIWAIMVLIGVAQLYLNWIFGLHFITSPTFAIGAFDFVTAILLIVVTFICGYVIGWLGAFILNKIMK